LSRPATRVAKLQLHRATPQGNRAPRLVAKMQPPLADAVSEIPPSIDLLRRRNSSRR
jgi:hypothetical protein